MVSLSVMKSNRWFYYCFFAFAIIFLAFAIGYIHFQWFYPVYFHGDSVERHVLAKVIIEEKSLLPLDFNYGNQINFVKAGGPSIVLPLLVGIKGYDAFALGSQLNICFWALILCCFLAKHFESAKKGLLFSALLLIPLGTLDFDYILGQQSHLSNVVLALGFVVLINRYLNGKSKLFLFIACITLFAMSWEAPIRGLLVVVPVLTAIALTSNLRTLFVIALYVLFSFALACITNAILVKSHPVCLSHFSTLRWASTNDFFTNLSNILGDYVASLSSINAVSGKKVRIDSLIVYLSGFLFVVANFSFISVGLLNTIRLILERFPYTRGLSNISKNLYGFFELSAVLGIVFGLFAVSSLDPDSCRHYLWAIFLTKLSIFVFVYNVVSMLTTDRVAAVAVVIISLMSSAWLADSVALGWNRNRLVENRLHSEEVRVIGKISRETGIHHVYGEDYWRVMPLNTLVDDMNAQELIIVGGEISIRNWLNRKSWAYVTGNVLYYLKNGNVDKEIQKKLNVVGGKKIHDGNGYTIWIGPPVWNTKRSYKFLSRGSSN